MPQWINLGYQIKCVFASFNAVRQLTSNTNPSKKFFEYPFQIEAAPDGQKDIFQLLALAINGVLRVFNFETTPIKWVLTP